MGSLAKTPSAPHPSNGQLPANQSAQGAKRHRREDYASDADDGYLGSTTLQTGSAYPTSFRKSTFFSGLGGGSSGRRPARSSRRPVRYQEVGEDHLSATGDFDYDDWQSTDSDEAEERRIAQSMGVIRKSANRGSAGGVKVHCDVCSNDVTSTVWLPFVLGAIGRANSYPLLGSHLLC